MGNLKGVQVVNTIKNLFEKLGCFLFSQRFLFSQEVKQLATCNSENQEAEVTGDSSVSYPFVLLCRRLAGSNVRQENGKLRLLSEDQNSPRFSPLDGNSAFRYVCAGKHPGTILPMCWLGSRVRAGSRDVMGGETYLQNILLTHTYRGSLNSLI